MKIFYTLLLSSTLATTINGMEEEKKPDETKKIEIQEEQDFIPKEQDCVSQIIIKQSNKKELFKKRKSYYETKTSIKINTSPRSEKKNPLFTAIEEKDYTTLQNLLCRDFINTTDKKHKNTSLHLAAREGFIDIVKILLTKKELKLNAKNIGGMTALHLAAQRKHYDIVELLLQHPGCDSSITTMDGKTTARELIEISQTVYRQKCFANVSVATEVNKATIHFCTSTIKPSLKDLVDHINKQIDKTYTDQKEEIPKDARRPDYITNDFLLEMLKLRIEAFERTPCSKILSCKSDTQLITKTTNPNKNNEHSDKKKKHSPLKEKSKSYHTPDSIETQQNSPLIMATKANDPAAVTDLLNPDYNCTDICGNTPLIHAVTLGYAKAVNMLLSKPEVDPNKQNQWGMPALLIAASKNHSMIIQQFILNPQTNFLTTNMNNISVERFIDSNKKKLLTRVEERKQLDTMIHTYISKTEKLDLNLKNTSPRGEKIEIIKYYPGKADISIISFDDIEKQSIKKLILQEPKLPSYADGNFIGLMIEHRMQTSQDACTIATTKELSDKKQIIMRKTD